jgi:hypothetical protein
MIKDLNLKLYYINKLEKKLKYKWPNIDLF